MGVYFVGLTATYIRAALEGGFGYLGGENLTAQSSLSGVGLPLAIISGLRLLAVLGLTARASALNDGVARLWLVPIVAGEFTLALLSANKESFVLLVLALAIPWVRIRRRLPVGTLLVAGAIFVLVVSPFVTQVRQAVRSDQERLPLAVALPRATSALVSGSAFARSGGEARGSWNNTVSRVRSIDNLMIIMDRTPEVIPYRSVAEIYTAPIVGLVPRAFWQDKPIRLSGQNFYRDYYNGPAVNSSAITMQGSLFMYGGAIALLVGMFVYGAAIRWVDDLATTLGSLRGSILIYILFVPVVKQELDVAGLAGSLVMYAASYFLGARVITVNGEVVEVSE